MYIFHSSHLKKFCFHIFIFYNYDSLFLDYPVLYTTCSYFTKYIDYSACDNVFLFLYCVSSVPSFSQFAFNSFFYGRGFSQMPSGPLLPLLPWLDILCTWIL